MTSLSHLKSQSLFIDLPEDSVSKTDQFYDERYVVSAPYCSLIDITYHLITSGSVQHERELLLLWEIRLSLLLFDERFSTARLEAVNLNNALFAIENPTSVAGTSSKVSDKSVPKIHPLPRNYSGLIGYLLLLLVLRLKSSPNLAFVNELYKLCYQIRLKGAPTEAWKAQEKLFNLCYEIISVLVTAGHHLTLLSFVQSLKQDTCLRSRSPTQCDLRYRRFASNIDLVWTYVCLKLRIKKGINDDAYRAYGLQIKQEWSSIDNSSKRDLLEIMNSEPHCEKSSLREIDPVKFLIMEFAELVKLDNISTRILCCTLATWSLKTFPFTEYYSSEDHESLEKVHSVIMAKWAQHVDKMYGIEWQ